MVFVPWTALGICKFWAMHKTECKFRDTCRWKHPPEEEVRRLWEYYEVKEIMGGGGEGEQDGGVVWAMRQSAGEIEPPLPPGHPVEVAEGWNARPPHEMPPVSNSDGVYDAPRPPWLPQWPAHSLPPAHNTDSGYSFLQTHQLPPRPPPPLTREWSQWAPDVGERFDDLRPSSSDGMSIPPHMHSEASYSRGYSSAPAPLNFTNPSYAHPPRQTHHQSQPHTPAYSTSPGLESTINKDIGEPFNPALSSNPFINGSLVYRFVWGDPLCVRCGYTGHLPKDCKGEALSTIEQECLYRLMREEQNRSKAERGFDLHAPTRSLAPEQGTKANLEPLGAPDLGEGLDGGFSSLDAPMSPKESGDSQERQKMDLDEQQQRRVQMLMSMDMKSGNTHDQKSNNGNSGKKNKKKGKAKREVGKEKEKPDKPDAKPVARKNVNRDLDLQRSKAELPSTFTTKPKAPVPLNVPSFFGMGATKRLSNGEAKSVGPHPSTIRVSAPYITQSAIEKRLQPASLDAQERSLAEAREDSVRLQGVTWLDNVRRALQLPVKTFTTACVYYHKFRLAHPTVEYNWSDAAAASLLTSCKNEDTLKKSRDILAAAYNLKQPGSHDQVGADDPIFEAPSRVVIGLERLVLESGGFDFRSRSPHQAIIKISKSLPESKDLKAVSKLAWTILTDLHRTFAPLKQTSATLALASLELAAHFEATKSDDNTCSVKDDLQALDLNKWHTTREEVMETLLDALDLYTHNTGSTILGTKYSLDDLLRIRLAFNKECSDSNLPRYTIVQPPPSPDNANGTSSTLRVANGHPTPVSPPQPGTQAPPQQNAAASVQPAPEGGGTLRFMLDPQRATDERTQVNRYYTEEWEEYEEEIEVPIPRNHSRERGRDRPERDGRPPREFDERRGPRDDRDTPHAPRGSERERIRESLADREREAERERARLRDRERERRYDDRRFEDRERERGDRRYDDRREWERGNRRYYDDDRRRGREDRR